MIYTSYWNNLKNLDKSLVVNISRWNNFWKGADCPELKPSSKMLIDFKEGKIGVKEYTYFFKWYLASLDVREFAHRLDGKIQRIFPTGRKDSLLLREKGFLPQTHYFRVV